MIEIEKVDIHSNLPDPGDYKGRVFLVALDEEGHKFGFYRCDGKDWNYVGNRGDTVILRINNDFVVGNPIELAGGKNVEIITDEGKIIVSAPNVNKTNLKHGPFLLSGEHIEIIAGPGIKISSQHPDKLIIGIDNTKEIIRIIELEKRVENLEKALAGVIKKIK